MARRPGVHLWLRKGKVKMTDDISVDKFCSWRDGILIFDNAPLQLICWRLQQLHNVEFSVSPEVADESFRIILRGEGLADVLEMLELCAPIDIDVEERADSGSAPHQYVTLSPQKQLPATESTEPYLPDEDTAPEFNLPGIA